MSAEQAPRADRFYAYDQVPSRRRAAASALQKRRQIIWMLIWTCAAILAALLLTFFIYAGLFDFGANETADQQKPVAETMNVGDLTFTGFDKKNQAYSISANSAEQDDEKPNIIYLNEVKAEMRLRRNDDVIYVTAARGTYDTEAETVRLESEIRLTSTNGYSATLDTADISLKEGRVHSDEPVVVSMSSGTIWANALDMWDRGKRILFKNRIRVLFKVDDKQADEG